MTINWHILILLLVASLLIGGRSALSGTSHDSDEPKSAEDPNPLPAAEVPNNQTEIEPQRQRLWTALKVGLIEGAVIGGALAGLLRIESAFLFLAMWAIFAFIYFRFDWPPLTKWGKPLYPAISAIIATNKALSSGESVRNGDPVHDASLNGTPSTRKSAAAALPDEILALLMPDEEEIFRSYSPTLWQASSVKGGRMQLLGPYEAPSKDPVGHTGIWLRNDFDLLVLTDRRLLFSRSDSRSTSTQTEYFEYLLSPSLIAEHLGQAEAAWAKVTDDYAEARRTAGGYIKAMFVPPKSIAQVGLQGFKTLGGATLTKHYFRRRYRRGFGGVVGFAVIVSACLYGIVSKTEGTIPYWILAATMGLTALRFRPWTGVKLTTIGLGAGASNFSVSMSRLFAKLGLTTEIQLRQPQEAETLIQYLKPRIQAVNNILNPRRA